MRTVLLIIAGLGSIGAAVAAAQATRSVEGTVRDATGAPVANARIELLGSGPVRTATSDARGRYRIDGLAAGRYTLAAQFTGFAPAAISVELARDVTTADVTLATVTSAESLTVTAPSGPRALDPPAPSGSRLGLPPPETPPTVAVISFAEAQGAASIMIKR